MTDKRLCVYVHVCVHVSVVESLVSRMLSKLNKLLLIMRKLCFFTLDLQMKTNCVMRLHHLDD